ncbi:MAG: protein kinase [Phycisphaerales bacterium JB050]
MDEQGSTREERTDRDGVSVKEAFASALDVLEDGGDLEAALAGVDAAVREAVADLLAAHQRAAGKLLDATDDTQTGWSGLQRDADARPIAVEPPVIEGYSIEEEIGRGGFGIVYRAMQRVPVERVVAVKLLRHELASRGVVRRFRAEGRLLARMNHEGIARVLDAGVDGRGRPFVVMEFVDGAPITTACEAKGLTVRERVALMSEVCEAVHHAHQRAVIHRDLKPANMLVEDVDGKNRARVIDFGIAKLLDADEGETVTIAGDRLGTPKYMSPEQREGSDAADVRSDVYALGVVLCEVLTGRVPGADEQEDGARSGHRSGLRSGSMSGLKPSAMAEIDPKTASRAKWLKGDLDRIVMKATARYPEARYPSAMAMAQDLKRYLEGRPVTATPPGPVYLVRKFIARHQAITAMAALLTIAVVGSVAALSYGIREAKLGRLEAESALLEEAIERARAQAMSDFLLGNMLTAIDPDLYQGEDRSLQAILQSTADEAVASLKQEPMVLMRVLERIGQSQRAIGDSHGAAATLTYASGLSAEHRGIGAPETIDLDLDVMLAHFSSKQPLNYRVEIDRLQKLAAENLPPGHAVRYRTELYELHAMPQSERAAYAKWMEQRIAASEHKGSALHYEAMRYLASILLHDDPEASLEIAERALADAIERYGARHSQTIEVRFTFAQALDHVGRNEEAEQEFRLLLKHAAELGGEQSVYYQTALSSVIRMLNDRGEYAESLALAEAQVERAIAQFGQRSGYYMLALRQVARCHAAASHWDEAEQMYERALGMYSRIEWTQVIESMKTRIEYGEMLVEAERPERAMEVLEPVIAGTKLDRSIRIPAIVLTAEAMVMSGRTEDATGFVEGELAEFERATGDRPKALVEWLGSRERGRSEADGA